MSGFKAKMDRIRFRRTR